MVKKLATDLRCLRANDNTQKKLLPQNFSVCISYLLLTSILKCANCQGDITFAWQAQPDFEFNLVQEPYDNDRNSSVDIQFSTNDLTLSINEEKNFTYLVSGWIKNISTILLEFNSTNEEVIDKIPSVTVPLTNYTQEMLSLQPNSNGYTLITVTTMPQNISDLSRAFLRLSVHFSPFLDLLSEIVGWTYFIAWSISFYPQIWLNWKRKSVIGLHFDFLALNTLGFLVYSIFNIGLYFIPEIEREYFRRHPYGVNPVQLNDVIFSLHALFACIVQVIQCFIYERGEQKISRTGRSLCGTFLITAVISLVLGSTSVIVWIDFLYILSYIKLFITLIKYIPQAYYNYLRKSTSGWSIGNIILDFTGGALSICQMFILSFNYNDWGSIFGDPTKFGLGLISISFDIFFMVQHYILYKGHENYLPFSDSPTITRSNSPISQNTHNYGTITEDS